MENIPGITAADLRVALAGDFAGEIADSTLTRAQYSTDAGNYRIVPQAIAFPRSDADVIALHRICRDWGIPITMRGAGTSCAGNAIGPGVVLDTSRHLNRILDIDPEARTARVEPGVILSDLQAAAAPHGLRFGPDPSTQNRCTIGGMIGNNACGPHAVAYGRTSDNVLSLQAIDGLGRHFTAGAGPEALQVIPQLRQLIDNNLGIIRPNLGRFHRQVSGYSLEHLTPEAGRNLAAALVGTEGTLASFTSATLKLVPRTAAPVLVVLGYASMPDAADAVPTLLLHQPLAVEGLDARLVEVVRKHRGPGAVPDLPPGNGWLMVEVGGEDEANALAAAQALAADAGTNAVAIYPPGAQAAALWRIRADGAGLGGRTPGANEQAWPGWEDAAVPPERLGNYLRDFDSLMKDHAVDGLVYGHFGEGCVHVRLDLPLGSGAGVPRARAFLEDAADLVASYGGSLSGEHGDGRARSELLPRMYPPELIKVFGQVKKLFDPDNLLNPGVLVAPDALDDHLRRPFARSSPALTGEQAGFAFEDDQGDFTTAVHRCTGVGKCRADNHGAGGFMCPSFQATQSESEATRGRARVLQEATNGNLITGWDAPEVMEVLDLCLACKACSTDCPAGVDMARYRSEILHRKYQGKLRPRTHYLLGMLPRWTRLLARVRGLPLLANVALAVPPLRWIVFKLAGLDPRRKMPHLGGAEFRRWVKRQQLSRGLPEAATNDPSLTEDESNTATTAGTAGPLAAVPASQRPRYVVVWADSFSQTLEGAGAQAVVQVLQQAGYTVLLPPEDVCCGLTWITTGQLAGARKRQQHLLGQLAPFAVNQIPIVGVEPSCTAVLRDDLLSLNPTDSRARAVAAQTYTLAELLQAPAPIGPGEAWQPPDLSQVSVVAQPHCHHYSVMGWEADQKLLTGAGAQVEVLTGCCGMAGNFGMETGHYDISVTVAQAKLLPTLAANSEAVFLADGFSCRTQARQLAGRDGVHLAQLLLR